MAFAEQRRAVERSLWHMTLRITWRYLVAFAALTMLCGTSHEFVHHFTGAILCHGFGTKTFNSFTLAPGCDADLTKAYWAAMAGPLFTFGLMWVGYFMLRGRNEAAKRLGFALIFANFPVNRMLFVVLNGNDEQYANRLMFGRSAMVYWLTVLAVYAVSLPPLIAAFRSIRAGARVGWFAGFFVLPFAFVVVFAGFLETYVLLGHHVLAKTIFGVPYLIVVVEILCGVVFEVFRKSLVAPVARREALRAVQAAA